jgi:hypothetical protein
MQKPWHKYFPPPTHGACAFYYYYYYFPCWLRTAILLTSASLVDKITGVSHRPLADACALDGGLLPFIHIYAQHKQMT